MNRAEAHIEERRRRVAELYLGGKVQSEIAPLVGCTQSTVSRDLHHAQDAWREAMVQATDVHKAQKLAEIALVKRAAWEAWARSQEPREITVTEASEGGALSAPARKASVRREGSAGAVQFLAEVRQCIAQEAAILGLNAPALVKVDLEQCTTEQLQRIAAGEAPERVVQKDSAPMAET